jgi:signal peptidase II
MSPRLRSAAIVAAVLVADRLTKIYIQTHFSALDVMPVIPGFFNIVHVENPGAAFGFLADAPSQWRRMILVAAALAVMAIISVMLFRPRARESALTQTGLALVLGGALGNFWDRAVRGTVTDFLQFFFGSYEFPSFNVADICIDVGAGLLLIDLWRSRKRTAPEVR